MADGDRDDRIVEISRYISPGLEEVERFSGGRQSAYGPRAGLLARSLGRYVDGVRDRVSEFLDLFEEEMGIDGDPRMVVDGRTVVAPRLQPTIDRRYTREEGSNLLHLQVEPRHEQRALGSRLARIGGEIGSQFKTFVLDDFVRLWRGVANRHSLTRIRTGAEHEMVFEGRDTTETGASRIVAPSRRFIDLARAVMKERTGDAEKAEFHLDVLVREYHYAIAIGQNASISVMGVTMDSGRGGEHSISVDLGQGLQQIACERGGLYLETDPSACARFRYEGPTTAAST